MNKSPASAQAAINPLAQLDADREAARERSDPWAALCAVATVTPTGEAEIRTLVLRHLNHHLALFFSATSPKWQDIKSTESIALLIYLPSIQVQYRVRSHWQAIPAELVHEHWQLRPSIPRQLDWFYQTQPQSSPIEDDELAALIAEGDAPTQAPASAMGIYLYPFDIERLQLSSDIHARHHYQRSGDAPGALDAMWHKQTLIP